MFNIGDKIVYPMHGAGTIESIEEKEILGRKNKYYIMRIPIDDMKVMIPIESMGSFGIRDIIGYSQFERVLDIFRQGCNKEYDNWGRRYRNNMNKIKSGDIFKIAEVVRDLMLREVKKGLSPGEKKIMENARQILFSELILVTGMKFEEIGKLIGDALSEGCC
jgi:CarD family transcriptional regulator